MENIPDNEMFNFKSIFELSFKIYRRIFLPTALGLLVLVLVLGGLISFLFPIVFKMSFQEFSGLLMSNQEKFQSLISSGTFYLNMLLFGVLTNCIIVPMSAGIYQGCKLAFEENPIPIKTIFSFYNSPFTGRIIGFTLLFILIETISSLLVGYMGMPSLSFSISIILRIITIFSIPMIIFENVSIGASFNNSIRSIAPNMLFISLILFIAGIIAFSGLFFFGIGIVITLPFWYAIVFILYFSVRGVKGGNMAV